MGIFDFLKKKTVISFEYLLSESKEIMKEEIKEYFETFQPNIKWLEFWGKCEKEIYYIN